MTPVPPNVHTEDTRRLPFSSRNVVVWLSVFAHMCHDEAVRAGWHSNEDGTPKERNIGEMLALCHSELSEALEGYRKGLYDDHLPHRKMVEVELADCMIRIGDLIGTLVDQGVLERVELGEAIVEKLMYNQDRADHKPENRYKEGGKKI